MKLQLTGIALLSLALAACGGETDEPVSPAAETPPAAETETPMPEEAAWDPTADPDYADKRNWLCASDKADDYCDTADLTATVIDVVDGEVVVSTEEYEAAADPAVDCFYVYPTTSVDDAGNADLDPEEEAEIYTTVGQFARFGEVCRTFAPMYRQVTLKSLRAGMVGQSIPTDRMMPINDIKAAWNYYLENYNEGRGVILVGHSQGSSVLQTLLATEIIGKPAQEKIIAAYPTGITYPTQEDGSFMGMPPCETKEQTGCIIAYSMFRENVPPSAESFFGVNSPRGEAMCVNPAAVAGNDGVLDSYLITGPDRAGTPATFAEGVDVETDFAKVPGLLSAECVATDSHHYLAVSINADPDDARTDEFWGDIFMADGSINEGWGLHLLDMHGAMGNLLTIAKAQAAAWEAKSE
ncbi:MAG: lysophospholipase [Ponticaulis sp.]|nr:lysophospholipase [Ponticaulis sp.]|tara:strand:- start:12272 stop:13504 length:1233 start_codon:yes stop_codon:yes gene_type:complete